MPELTLFSVFLVGLFGGVHCAGMCGGIVAVLGAAGRPAPIGADSGDPAGAPSASAIPAQTIPIRAAPTPMSRQLGYNLGRIASYTLAGAIAGTLGSTTARRGGLLPLQQIAFAATNLLL
ncbi:MAG: sulfite exporter TauE/SafE family protein, partial [Burkholderiaceae bacterium]|nr:sulfite exporter TauE/SafE family protein [Burkholderiaceae bacterium]